MVRYGLNKITLAFDAQYKIVIHTAVLCLLTYLVSLALVLKMLSLNPSRLISITIIHAILCPVFL